MAPPFPLFLEPNEGTPEDKGQQVADGREESGGGGGEPGCIMVGVLEFTNSGSILFRIPVR